MSVDQSHKECFPARWEQNLYLQWPRLEFYPPNYSFSAANSLDMLPKCRMPESTGSNQGLLVNWMITLIFVVLTPAWALGCSGKPPVFNSQDFFHLLYMGNGEYSDSWTLIHVHHLLFTQVFHWTTEVCKSLIIPAAEHNWAPRNITQPIPT